MVGTMTPSGKYDLQIVRSEVIMEERGDNFPACHPWDTVVDQGFQPLEVPDPFFTGNGSWLGHFFWYRRPWSIVVLVFFVFFICRWWWSRIY